MIQAIPNALKSLLLVAALATASLAFALPTPKDIETAVNQGHVAQAESMLREVIAAKPQSPKAHYELGQVLLREHRNAEAHAELLQARTIDPSLKFASSAQQFNELLDRSAAAAHPPTSATAPQVTAKPPGMAGQTGLGFDLSYVWIGIAALGVIGLLIRMNRPAPLAQSQAPAPTNGPLSTAFGRQPTSGYAPGYAPAAGYPAGYPAANPSGGSTLTGAVVGGLAGVAAGYALSKAMEGEHHSTPTPPASGSGNGWADNQGLVSMDEPRAPAFDAGSGDGWGGDDLGSDSPDSSGGSDDNW